MIHDTVHMYSLVHLRILYHAYLLDFNLQKLTSQLKWSNFVISLRHWISNGVLFVCVLESQGPSLSRKQGMETGRSNVPEQKGIAVLIQSVNNYRVNITPPRGIQQENLLSFPLHLMFVNAPCNTFLGCLGHCTHVLCN